MYKQPFFDIILSSQKIKGGCLCLNYIILKKILLGMTKAESSATSDIARELEDKFDFVQHDSNAKRIRWFYNNKLFNGENFYDALI
mgnify:FL=1